MHNSIFPEKYLDEKISSFELGDINNKRDIILGWKKAIENKVIQNSKEEALQADFLNKFFGEVLDYSYNLGESEWNLTKEEKSQTDSTKADGALGYFAKGNNKDVRVVIELKDAKTDLDKPQNRKNDKRSPVEQAFSYAHKAGDNCRWVIVSNFVEVRLYRANDSSKYEVFEITELLTKLDNIKKFYYLLHKDRLISRVGDSEIDKLYNNRQAHEKAIEDKFYKEFKQTRWDLFQHLIEHNTGIPERVLFEKAQKLLDRFIFVFFCEDFLPALIPSETTNNLLKNQSYTSLWDQVKGLFLSIDKGNTRLDINKFNGGLFSEDSILNSLNIEDDMLIRIIQIGKDYDFNSDLNVNILGHIFEQSISDIEEIKAQIDGEEFEKKKGKRKKDGIFYTPAYITKYIVEQTIGRWLDERKQELKIDLKSNQSNKKQLELWKKYKGILSNIKVLDPACGSGAFLNQAFDYLLQEHERVNSRIAELNNNQRDVSENMTSLILQNNIYGVDLNEESVEITKLSLWLKTARKGQELTSLDNNIKCGNSLIDDPEVAGDKAFVWEEEFAEIMGAGGFDIVIGNPPWVFTKGQKYDSNVKDFFSRFINKLNIQAMSKGLNIQPGKINLFGLFVLKSFRLLSKLGYQSFILPNTILRATNYALIRKYLIQNSTISQIIDLGENVFEDVTASSTILLLKAQDCNRSFNTEVIYQIKSIASQSFKTHSVNQLQFLSNQSHTFNILVDETKNNILNKISKGKQSLLSLTLYISPGIDCNKEQNIFGSPSNTLSKPLLFGKDFNRYYLPKASPNFISYIPSNLNRARNEEIFLSEKLIGQRISGGKRPLRFTYDNSSYYTFNSVNNIVFKNNSGIKYYLSLLNSSLINWFFTSKFTNESLLTVNISKTYLSEIPIPDISLEQQQPFVELADIMLDKNEELQDINNKFQKLLIGDFQLDKLSQKLQSWYELDWEGFLKELEKKKVKLTLSQKAEWMDYFEKEKAKALAVKEIIDNTDKEIDKRVYELYELTDEEIEIIEGRG